MKTESSLNTRWHDHWHVNIEGHLSTNVCPNNIVSATDRAIKQILSLPDVVVFVDVFCLSSLCYPSVCRGCSTLQASMRSSGEKTVVSCGSWTRSLRTRRSIPASVAMLSPQQISMSKVPFTPAACWDVSHSVHVLKQYLLTFILLY